MEVGGVCKLGGRRAREVCRRLSQASMIIHLGVSCAGSRAACLMFVFVWCVGVCLWCGLIGRACVPGYAYVHVCCVWLYAGWVGGWVRSCGYAVRAGQGVGLGLGTGWDGVGWGGDGKGDKTMWQIVIEIEIGIRDRDSNEDESVGIGIGNRGWYRGWAQSQA